MLNEHNKHNELNENEMKVNQRIFKIIALALIQAFLVMDCVWAGGDEVLKNSQDTQKISTLAPKLCINAEGLRMVFYDFNPPSRNSPPVRMGMDSEKDSASARFSLRRSEEKDSTGVSPWSFNKTGETKQLTNNTAGFESSPKKLISKSENENMVKIIAYALIACLLFVLLASFAKFFKKYNAPDLSSPHSAVSEEESPSKVSKHTGTKEAGYKEYYRQIKEVEVMGEKGGPEAVKYLTNEFERSYKDHTMRINIIKALVEIGSQDAIEFVGRALNKEGDVRILYLVAAEGLGENGSLEAIKYLIGGLKHNDDKVKKTIFESLIEISMQKGKKTHVKGALINALGDENYAVREKAAEMLKLNFNWKPKTSSQKINYFIAVRNWEELVEIGNPAIPSLIKRLKDESPLIRKSAAGTLGKIGDLAAREALVQALKDGNAEVCESVFIALREIIGDDVEACSLFIESLLLSDAKEECGAKLDRIINENNKFILINNIAKRIECLFDKKTQWFNNPEKVKMLISLWEYTIDKGGITFEEIKRIGELRDRYNKYIKKYYSEQRKKLILYIAMVIFLPVVILIKYCISKINKRNKRQEDVVIAEAEMAKEKLFNPQVKIQQIENMNNTGTCSLKELGRSINVPLINEDGYVLDYASCIGNRIFVFRHKEEFDIKRAEITDTITFRAYSVSENGKEEEVGHIISRIDSITNGNIIKISVDNIPPPDFKKKIGSYSYPFYVREDLWGQYYLGHKLLILTIKFARGLDYLTYLKCYNPQPTVQRILDRIFAGVEGKDLNNDQYRISAERTLEVLKNIRTKGVKDLVICDWLEQDSVSSARKSRSPTDIQIESPKIRSERICLPSEIVVTQAI